MLTLDTHILIWLRAGDRRLGSRTRRRVEEALTARQAAASSICFWEAAMLAESGRVDLGYDADEWSRLLLQEGLVEIPVNNEIAIRAARLRDFHRDPADRIIVATALEGHELVTADARILAWPGPLRRSDARL